MDMKKLALVIVIASACGKKAPPPPFKGTLTPDLILASKDTAKPFMAWADGLAAMQAKLGVPTKVDGNKYWWAAEAGDDCAYTMIEQEDGKKFNRDGLMVGEVQEPGKYGKNDAIMNRAECLKILGKGPQEDPNAKGPPADGSAITVAELTTEAPKARSKWDSKDIKVTGVIKAVAGTDATLVDGDKTLRCVTPNGNFAFDDKPTTIHGTVKYDEWVNGAGETHYEVHLEPCDFVR